MLKRAINAGFTLVEALVALALMLAGIAGAAVLLLQSLQHERESATRRAAVRLAGSLAEELRAMRRSDNQPLAPDAAPIAGWLTGLRASLPDGASGRVQAGTAAPATYRITIEWPGSGSGAQRLTLWVTT